MTLEVNDNERKITGVTSIENLISIKDGQTVIHGDKVKIGNSSIYTGTKWVPGDSDSQFYYLNGSTKTGPKKFSFDRVIERALTGSGTITKTGYNSSGVQMKYVATTSLANDVKTYGYAAAQGTAQTLSVLTDQTGAVTNGAPRIEVLDNTSAQVGMNISGSGIVAGTQIIGTETVGTANYIYLSIAPSSTIAALANLSVQHYYAQDKDGNNLTDIDGSAISVGVDSDGINASSTATASYDYFHATTNTIKLCNEAATSCDGNLETDGQIKAGTVDAATLKIGSVAVTANASELNILDGVTATKDQLNK